MVLRRIWTWAVDAWQATLTRVDRAIITEAGQWGPPHMRTNEQLLEESRMHPQHFERARTSISRMEADEIEQRLIQAYVQLACTATRTGAAPGP